MDTTNEEFNTHGLAMVCPHRMGMLEAALLILEVAGPSECNRPKALGPLPEERTELLLMGPRSVLTAGLPDPWIPLGLPLFPCDSSFSHTPASVMPSLMKPSPEQSQHQHFTLEPLRLGAK